MTDNRQRELARAAALSHLSAVEVRERLRKVFSVFARCELVALWKKSVFGLDTHSIVY